MTDLLSELVLQMNNRIPALREWSQELLASLSTGGPDWANPFSKELLLCAVQGFNTDAAVPSLRRTGDAIQSSYTEWLTPKGEVFVPEAFAGSVWVGNRNQILADVSNRVDASLSKYFRSHSQWIPAVDEFDVRFLKESFLADIALRNQLPKRTEHLHGGVLSVEAYIRFIENRMHAVFPEIHKHLGWNAPNGDMAIRDYIRGASEAEITNTFIRVWKSRN